MALLNHQFRLTARPVGLPKPTDWTYTEEPVRALADGEVLVKVLDISLDPAMRGWMNEGKSYVPPVALGEVMRALGVGQVVASKYAGLPEGTFVSGLLGVQEYAVTLASELVQIDPQLAPLPVYLNTLGMPGMTAYFGLLEVGHAKRHDTVVVSGAAGAVGALVGQIAHIKGCQVIGIAGGPEKCAYLTDELGFDGAIDYKKANVNRALHELCPGGIDVYFDNVGGDILDAALANLARGARIVICGAISQYNVTGPVRGPANYLSLLVNRASMTGFVVFDYAARYGEAAREMAAWLASGELKSREDVVKGLSNFPEALLRLFSGANAGKLVLAVAES